MNAGLLRTHSWHFPGEPDRSADLPAHVCPCQSPPSPQWQCKPLSLVATTLLPSLPRPLRMTSCSFQTELCVPVPLAALPRPSASPTEHHRASWRLASSPPLPPLDLSGWGCAIHPSTPVLRPLSPSSWIASWPLMTGTTAQNRDLVLSVRPQAPCIYLGSSLLSACSAPGSLPLRGLCTGLRVPGHTTKGHFVLGGACQPPTCKMRSHLSVAAPPTDSPLSGTGQTHSVLCDPAHTVAHWSRLDT